MLRLQGTQVFYKDGPILIRLAAISFALLPREAQDGLHVDKPSGHTLFEVAVKMRFDLPENGCHLTAVDGMILEGSSGPLVRLNRWSHLWAASRLLGL
jgi:hypothetical protein